MKGLFCLFERRPIMEKKRKDSRGRVLRKGEAFRENYPHVSSTSVCRRNSS